MSIHNPEEFQRIEYEGDPERCQHIGNQGQCSLKAINGTKFCKSHGGVVPARVKENNFYRTKWRAQIQAKLDDNNDVYDLTEEIGILRLMLENLLSQCKDEFDLMLATGPISDLVLKVDRTVSSLHKLRQANGDLLDKTAILRFVSIVIDILTRHFGDQTEKLEQVAQEILGAADGSQPQIVSTNIGNSIVVSDNPS